MEYLILSKIINERIGIITLNNPKSLNALSEKLIQELIDKIDEFKVKKIQTLILNAKLIGSELALE